MARAAAGRVAVVVPVYRPTFDDDEQISLRHLSRFLSRYDRARVSPHGLEVELDGFRVERFPKRYFRSQRTYSDLLLTKRFYRRFSDYDYILVYQLDSLVFADELETWCGKGYDYIGAVHVIEGTALVGNGGFSLRRVGRFLEVLESKRRTVDAREHWARHWAGRPASVRTLNLPRKYLKRLRAFNGVQWEIRCRKRSYGWPEDWFWSLRAPKYVPEFRIAPNDEADRFAFFGEPRETFAAIGGRLPFGCHGWPRFDRDFWEPYLLRD
jgi:hypothetical protein